MATLYRLHRIVPVAAAQCPPCHGECAQGRFCKADAPASGSADPLGDDQAERTSAWGALEECATEGGKHREPTDTGSYPGPSVGWVLFLAVACIASVGACWVLAPYLPLNVG